MKRRFSTVIGLLAVVCVVGAAGADWPTHRGNLERTGNVDGQPGPKSPKVLWVHRAAEQFVASPVAGDKHLYVSGLGAFNSAVLHAVHLDARPGKQIAWSKLTPVLKLPVVSSPAVVGGKLIFGDGMHQTDGALLHCLDAGSGLPLWQLPMPGRLVHLEGAPTVSGGRVYMTGGNAGVFCIDPSTVTLEGKELDVNAVQPILEKRWKELLARFEEDKKKDPDFAIPPNEDMLPKPAPKKLWQQGQDKWHVDASLAVAGDKVLAASSFLDDEKIGDRRLYCLKASDGSVRWQQPLRLNPWAGPTVADKAVVVGGSNIRFDPKTITEGRGEITAFDLETGAVRWRKSLPGGVVSPVAAASGLAVLCGTDGKVRAFDLSSGQEKWTYTAKGPLFAAPAVVGGVVYAADLKGVVHAVQLADGEGVWTLDLGADPAVKAPGMVYGSPIVHQGRLYLATCNLEGEHARQPAVIVCIGDK